MKQKIFVLISILTFLCSGSKVFAKSSAASTLKGVFEYIYPHNTDDLVENHYIVLEAKNKKISGTYFGTSDDFDSSREGYKPGFFKSKMLDLVVDGEKISFKIKVKKTDFFSSPITPFSKKTQNRPWTMGMSKYEREYSGTINENVITITSPGIDSREFKKK